MESPEMEVLDAAPAESATAIALYDPIEAGLAKLREEGAEAFDVKTTEGNKAAREFVQRCVGMRTATDEAYTNWNRPLMALQKRAREKRDEITASIKEVEQPVKDLVDAEQKRKDEERIEKARAESARISTHQACLNAIISLPKDYLSASVVDVTAAIRDLESPEYLGQRDWQEYADQAKEAVDGAMTTLRAHLENARAREELAAMRAQQQAEAAARQAVEEAAEAERQRIASIKDRIHAIEMAASTCIGLGVKQIQQRIDSLAREAADDFGEFQADAGAAIEAALGNLNTMFAAASDAEELQQLRADREKREREAKEAIEAAARAAEQAEAKRIADEKAAEARRQAEVREAEEKRQREGAAARRREQEAAEASAQRVREQAGALLALLVEARPHVPAGELADRIDATINAATGSAA